MMHKLTLPVIAAVAVGLLSSCSDGSLPTPAAIPSESATAAPSLGPSTGPTGTAPDATSTIPAPSVPAPAELSPGPGNAELSVTVVPGEDMEAVHYTLVCTAGDAVAESSHPLAQEACAALKADPSVLRSSPDPDRVCTQQYGGPQTATVTGVVNGVPVEASFSRINGCEISAWDAAANLLGGHGGTY